MYKRVTKHTKLTFEGGFGVYSFFFCCFFFLSIFFFFFCFFFFLFFFFKLTKKKKHPSTCLHIRSVCSCNHQVYFCCLQQGKVFNVLFCFVLSLCSDRCLAGRLPFRSLPRPTSTSRFSWKLEM